MLTILAVSASKAPAANRWWDGPSNAGACDGVGAGGTANWGNSNTNWDQGNLLDHTNWVNAAEDTAIFEGTPGTVSITHGLGVTVSALIFQTNGFILDSITNTRNVNCRSGGIITYVNVASNSTATINAIITNGPSANRSLQVGGRGTLVLNGSNMFNGQIVIGNNAPANASTAIFNGGNGSGQTPTVQASIIANLGVASSLGQQFTEANGTIRIGDISTAGILEYIGTNAASTDRKVQVGSSSSSGSGGASIFNNTPDAAHTLTFSNPDFNLAATGVTTANRTLTLGGTNSGDNTISGAITNNVGTSGGLISLTKSGSGTWVLSGPSTYSGNTTISGGKLKAAIIAGLGVVSSLGQPSTEATGIIQIGSASTSATLEYTGASPAATDRKVRVGSSSNGSGGATILNNSANAANTLIFAGAAFNTAAINISSSTNRNLRLGGSNPGANEIQGAIIDNVLTSLAPSTVSLIKEDAGTWILSGTNTYGGSTTVSGGTLLINGDSSAVNNSWTVNVAGTLGGVGTIGGPVAVNGSLAPGASIGKLRINGDLTFGAGSTNLFEVNGSTPTNDVVVLGGSVTYDGVLKIVSTGTFTVSQTFTLFSGAGAASASNFSSIEGSPGSGKAFSFTNGVLSVISTAAPVPTIGPVTVSGGNLQGSVPSVSGYNYVLQTATNLNSPILWTDISTNAGTGGNLSFSVPVGADPQKFVRFWIY